VRWLAVGLCALAAALTLPSLGDQALWQDEAQTALVARTILDGGLPRGTDGTNFFSQELGKEYAADHLWRWHTWLSFYLTAASFALLGETTLAARLPFALLGVLCTGLCFATARRLWRDPLAAAAAGALCALSVPFLIFSRQCRYYTLAAALLLGGMLAYASLRRGARAPTAWLFVCAFLLFHAHYVYCGTLLAGLALHAAIFERERLRPLLWAGAAVAVLDLPWIVWFSGVRPGGDAYFASVLDGSKWLRFSGDYLRLLGRFLPPWLLIVPLLVAALRWRRGEAPFAVGARTASGVGLVVCVVGASVALLAALSPLRFYRYLAPLAPPLFVLGGLLVAALLRQSRALGAALVAALLATSSLGAYLGELRGELGGPIDGIVAFLEQHAAPDDVVAISYGDLPLKFYLNNRVIGGLTGEDLDELGRARWLIPRHYTNTEADRRVKRALLEELRRAPDAFVRHRLEAPDLPFENREDPAIHRFAPAPPRAPRVQIFERIR
jgi:4-amino-4-deoxy-L-arabinose transferase-like glycosyltransferase